MPVRVVDTRQAAEKRFKVFYAREPERDIELQFSWPERMQEIGEGAAEMYRSNKWQKDRKDTEDYKHVPGLEGGSRLVYATPGFLREHAHPARPIRVVGPMVDFEPPMPQHFTVLGPLLGVQMHLYERGKDGEPVLTKDRYYEVRVARGMLGAAEHPGTRETFLLVYSRKGVHMLLTGPKLEIEKDGIAG